MEGTFQCKQMGKSFSGDGVETHALQDIEVTLEAGDFISIIGPSGSGKSTLLSLIGTLDRPTSGELHYDGKPINKLNSKELSDFRFENIGFIFQQFHLIPTLTALENVMAPLFGRKVPYDKKERAEQYSHKSVSLIKQAVCRRNFPVDNNNGSPLPEHSSMNRNGCLPTSRQGTSIRIQEKSSSISYGH